MVICQPCKVSLAYLKLMVFCPARGCYHPRNRDKYPPWLVSVAAAFEDGAKIVVVPRALQGWEGRQPLGEVRGEETYCLRRWYFSLFHCPHSKSCDPSAHVLLNAACQMDEFLDSSCAPSIAGSSLPRCWNVTKWVETAALCPHSGHQELSGVFSGPLIWRTPRAAVWGRTGVTDSCCLSAFKAIARFSSPCGSFTVYGILGLWKQHPSPWPASDEAVALHEQFLELWQSMASQFLNSGVFLLVFWRKAPSFLRKGENSPANPPITLVHLSSYPCAGLRDCLTQHLCRGTATSKARGRQPQKAQRLSPEESPGGPESKEAPPFSVSSPLSGLALSPLCNSLLRVWAGRLLWIQQRFSDQCRDFVRHRHPNGLGGAGLA